MPARRTGHTADGAFLTGGVASSGSPGFTGRRPDFRRPSTGLALFEVRAGPCPTNTSASSQRCGRRSCRSGRGRYPGTGAGRSRARGRRADAPARRRRLARAAGTGGGYGRRGGVRGSCARKSRRPGRPCSPSTRCGGRLVRPHSGRGSGGRSRRTRPGRRRRAGRRRGGGGAGGCSPVRGPVRRSASRTGSTA